MKVCIPSLSCAPLIIGCFIDNPTRHAFVTTGDQEVARGVIEKRKTTAEEEAKLAREALEAQQQRKSVHACFAWALASVPSLNARSHDQVGEKTKQS